MQSYTMLFLILSVHVLIYSLLYTRLKMINYWLIPNITLFIDISTGELSYFQNEKKVLDKKGCSLR